MYDFSTSEISEPVKTIAWLLQNKPERFSISEMYLDVNKTRLQLRLVDDQAKKIFYVNNQGNAGLPTIEGEDWITPVEKLYLAQEVLALVSRNKNAELQKEKGRWLEAYRDDICGEVSSPEAKPEPAGGVEYELSPLEKVAKEHTAKLLAEEVKKQDLKSIQRVIVIGALALLVPLVYLYLSK